MKIQFFSDVHLEFGVCAHAETDADVIVAAGDIDVGVGGVEWLKQQDKPTIYITGNHEFYGGEMGAVREDIERAAAGTNVHYLECQSVVIDGVRFLGATLWTDFMQENQEVIAALESRMNDYQHIRCGARELQPGDLIELNRITKAWMEQELAVHHDGKTVVVTHHAPLNASWHMPANSIFRSAYCNNLSQFVLDYKIDLWIHGHVHAKMDYMANDLRVVCNPRGYDGYQLVEGYDPARVITI